MYIITKDYKRTFKNNTFASYDSARCFLRKLLRQRHSWWCKTIADYSNPNLSDFGYSIKKI